MVVLAKASANNTASCGIAILGGKETIANSSGGKNNTSNVATSGGAGSNTASSTNKNTHKGRLNYANGVC